MVADEIQIDICHRHVASASEPLFARVAAEAAALPMKIAREWHWRSAWPNDSSLKLAQCASPLQHVHVDAYSATSILNLKLKLSALSSVRTHDSCFEMLCAVWVRE